MILHSIGEVDLIVDNIFDVVTSTFKEMNHEYSPNKTHFDQIVEGQSIDKIYTMMFSMLITTSIVDIVIGITEFNNSNMYCILTILTVCTSDTIIHSSFINLHVLFSSIITLFNELSDILTKFSINCMVSLHDCCGSYYKFINWYCCLFTHLRVILLLIRQLELVIYDTFDIGKQHFKDANDRYNKKNNRYVLVSYYQQNQGMSSGLFAIDWIIDLILSRLWYLTGGYQLKMILFIHVAHIILSFCTKLTDFLNISPRKQDNACANLDLIVDASICICNCIVLLQELIGTIAHLLIDQ